MLTLQFCLSDITVKMYDRRSFAWISQNRSFNFRDTILPYTQTDLPFGANESHIHPCAVLEQRTIQPLHSGAFWAH
ncbi:uncharacterized protein ARMOST_14371 [Armillaria ostoyae]|uniref:Uncharacterized protein n=1 Tax=Armillaria ostoyae TaxID=47428 RepID=A0A284RQJ9_ARMOS|nr:uncharacterized protein ARMOST_14371 [Armillaria ostoyae]